MFILILCAIIVAGIWAFFMLFIADSSDAFYGPFLGMFGVLLAVVVGISLLAYCPMTYHWYASKHKMNIINREFEKHYSQKEVFFASDVIDIVRQLDRKRIEINGNILKSSD